MGGVLRVGAPPNHQILTLYKNTPTICGVPYFEKHPSIVGTHVVPMATDQQSTYEDFTTAPMGMVASTTSRLWTTQLRKSKDFELRTSVGRTAVLGGHHSVSVTR